MCLEGQWNALDGTVRVISGAIGLCLGFACSLWAPRALTEPVGLGDVYVAFTFLSSIGLFGLLALGGTGVRGLVVDWDLRQLHARKDPDRAVVPFDAVSSLRVLVRRMRTEVRGRRGAAYQGVVIVGWLDPRSSEPRETEVLDTSTVVGDAVTPFKWAAGLAVALAGWLGVPCLHRRGEADTVPLLPGRPMGDGPAETSPTEDESPGGFLRGS